MKSYGPMKLSEIRAELEAKRDKINLLLPTVAPSIGVARVEREADNYVLRIGEKIVVKRGLFTSVFPWAYIGSDGRDNFLGKKTLNDAVVGALPNEVRAEFRRKLNAG
jgi:hypothetical protein